jgi:2-keto-4-pentenoate hydratase/2-oxohepta-3-ene-1,7-dioic acid hydratase in catechol pathway
MVASRREFLAGTGGAILAAAGSSSAFAAPGAPPLRFACFSATGESAPRVAIVVADDRLLDIGAEAARRKVALPFDPGDMISLIASGEPGFAAVRGLVDGGQALVDYRSARHWSPIPRPARNIYAVGWNYLEHFAESATARAAKTDYPEHPVFFTKGTHTMNGPFDTIPYDPKVSTLIDWEGELAVVIGKRGKNIAEADALGHVFGYSVFNDTTARDVQQKRHGGQWFKGKSLDGHGPMGPWIVEAAALDPDTLHLQTRVNGVTKQDAMTTQMYFKVPRIIAELSLGLTLEPGDVIATGTPSGVGVGRTPPEFLKPGDVMETEIAGIGTLRNTIASVS